MSNIPFLIIGVGFLAVGTLLCLWHRQPGTGRTTAAITSVFALLCFACTVAVPNSAPNQPGLGLLPFSLRSDSLNAMPMVFFTALHLVLILIAPKRDTNGRTLSGMMLLCLGTVTAYAAASLPALAAGWWITAAPFLLGLFGNTRPNRVNALFLMASAAALSAFTYLTHNSSLESFSHANHLAFAFLLAAVALRKGLFPLHSWVVASFEHGPLIPSILLFNGHLGAFLTARTEAVQLPGYAHQALDWLGVLALATALLASIRGFAEKTPRRLLAFVCISQASFILAGLATANEQGITGALLHWFVVSVASSILAGIVRILEVRVMDVADPKGNLGLAVRAPRLATFFLIAALALVGLPGTLGYNAEDLLFHGALESHPWMGVSMLAATAFNAINLLRLYTLLFLGVLPKHVIEIPDALPRERWPVTACALILIGGSLFSNRVFPLISGATHRIHLAPEHPPTQHP
jgi:NADH:ubiquinone oxidoreductase subunit 4 (subunit M)